ncbi:cupin domain-containing protein [Undibacterium sp. TS12]|uniref:cupin domain-containing protein n=1 Tax=Undibacterium sp. TS12 TaxID=2908202 RepID=UPI001F4D0511|nr:cupin domain-containing protein [Undibacterium sp. TS12]MCH8621510.1 cupin domain-containing protein [Undibacterium sp. TS12]
MTDSKKAITAAGITRPFMVDEVPWDEFAHGERFGSRYRQLGEYGGCQHVGVSMEELAPGKQACPNHYHHLEEEQLMMLEGTATLRLGDDNYVLVAGSYVVFPAGQKAGHSIYNHSDAPCRYLVIGERNPHDVVVYPDSNRVGVRLTGEGYNKSATMEYWEGEKQ